MSTTAISFSNELIEAFVCATWLLPLTAEERISLMTTLPLVNSTWRDTYNHVSSKDVHIPCAAFRDYFFHHIELFNTRCRSVTFTVAYPAALSQDHNDNSSKHRLSIDRIEDIFYAIEYPDFPNLTKVAIRYHNANFDDIFKNTRLADLPSQVVVLEVEHTFSPNVPPFLVSALRQKHHAELGLPWRMHNVKRLSLRGVGNDYVADMVAACPNLRELELSLAPHTDFFISLPPSLEALSIYDQEGIHLLAHPSLPLDGSRWLYLRASKACSILDMHKWTTRISSH